MLKRKPITKSALCISMLLIVLWVVLGANASLAWFQEEDEIVNSLFFGDLKLNLYHKTNTGYEAVDSTTKVFDEAALYEPGYTQIVVLCIENAGTIDFDCQLSVVPDLANVVVAKNEHGGEIFLPDHLKFGAVFGDTEEALLEKISDRALAQKNATEKLSNYSENVGTVAVGGSTYCALVLYMPEEVANEANYRGDTVPSVEVGISVLANQTN